MFWILLFSVIVFCGIVENGSPLFLYLLVSLVMYIVEDLETSDDKKYDTFREEVATMRDVEPIIIPLDEEETAPVESYSFNPNRKSPYAR